MKVREEQTTPILTQVRGDVTRYRYGDEQHLEEALKIIFRFNRPGGLRRNQAPELVGLSEQIINDRYALCLEFESPKMEFTEWTDRVSKITTFFGPGVVAAATRIDGDEHKVEIALITTGEGGGEMQDMEVLTSARPWTTRSLRQARYRVIKSFVVHDTDSPRLAADAASRAAMTAPDLSRFDEGSSDEDDFIARVRARELAEGADDASADADASPPTTSGGGGDDKTDADARAGANRRVQARTRREKRSARPSKRARNGGNWRRDDREGRTRRTAAAARRTPTTKTRCSTARLTSRAW